jgi:hypothetical protein
MPDRIYAIGGVIVAWNFYVSAQIPTVSNANEVLTSSSVSGDSVLYDVLIPLTPPYTPYSITGSSNTPGTWTCQTTYSSNFP